MNIVFNGKDVETTARTVEQFVEAFGIKGEIVLVADGYCVTMDEALTPNMHLVIVDKNSIPSDTLLKEMMAARITPGLFFKYSKAKVAIAGLGGLGSNIAIMLARSGVGYLKLIDFDIVEPTNLNRQSYTIKDLGKPKTEALKEYIQKINPYILVEVVSVKMDENNTTALIENCDIVCEAFDNAKNKAMLVNLISEVYPQKYIVAASGMAGTFDSNLIKTKKLGDRLYICGDFHNGAKKGTGLMSPRVSICAGHQANKVLQIIEEIY